MSFLSRFFSSGNPGSIKTTAASPFRISRPAIGFLNLQGEAASALLESDKTILCSIFAATTESVDAPPKCEVLFLYCSLDEQGRIVDSQATIRQVIESAGAYVAVVASENSGEAYVKALGRRTSWHANIAMVIDRKGEKFAHFFRRLFESMYSGKSMPLAWVELAPQIPGQEHPDAPATVMAAEAGHLTFTDG
jgi:hypothetical protein